MAVDRRKADGWFSRRYKDSKWHEAGRVTRAVVKDEKQEALVKRQAARKSRTPGQQLARLDSLLGKGVGAKRERKRLEAQMK